MQQRQRVQRLQNLHCSTRGTSIVVHALPAGHAAAPVANRQHNIQRVPLSKRQCQPASHELYSALGGECVSQPTTIR